MRFVIRSNQNFCVWRLFDRSLYVLRAFNRWLFVRRSSRSFCILWLFNWSLFSLRLFIQTLCIGNFPIIFCLFISHNISISNIFVHIEKSKLILFRFLDISHFQQARNRGYFRN